MVTKGGFMDAKPKSFYDIALGGFNNAIYKLNSFFGVSTPRGSKHANRKKMKQDPRLVKLAKKAARKRAYASRRINHKRAQGIN